MNPGVATTGTGDKPRSSTPPRAPEKLQSGKPAGAVQNAMSVDVEEYFQAWALSRAAPPSEWDSLSSRIDASVRTVLDLFAAADVRATFFTLGWVAERHPQLIRDIGNAGHEIASHGYAHRKVTEQSPAEFRDDVVRAKSILEDVSGSEVTGYRAPSFSICADNLWALDILRETGHSYSSSVYPIAHDHYGMPEASRFAFRRQPRSVLEIPLSTVDLLGRSLPCGGGGYFRLFPYRYFRWAIRRINERDGHPAVFYFHPWEVDPQQPRLRDIPLRSRFRHYVNLHRTERRLGRLLSDFSWGRMDEVFAARRAATECAA